MKTKQRVFLSENGNLILVSTNRKLAFSLINMQYLGEL